MQEPELAGMPDTNPVPSGASHPGGAAVSRRAILAIPLLLGAGGLAACSSNGGDTAPAGASAGNGGTDELFAETASFETVAMTRERVMVGLSTRDGRVLHGGMVRFTFTPVDGTAATSTEAESFMTEAAFLPVPRSAVPPNVATIGNPSDGIGVYEAVDVRFPRPGFWTITVDVDLPKKQRVETAIEVLAKPRVPAAGDPAPRTDNPTKPGGDVTLESIDSRSGPAGLADLADPLLHRESVASVLAAGRPCVVIVSTPAFCVSKFCGPLTDVVNDLAKEAQDAKSNVGFVHLEVWRSFENQEVNRFAAEWILPNGAEGREPWVFLVGGDGVVVQRWDNLVAESNLRSAIASLS